MLMEAVVMIFMFIKALFALWFVYFLFMAYLAICTSFIVEHYHVSGAYAFWFVLLCTAVILFPFWDIRRMDKKFRKKYEIREKFTIYVNCL